MTKRERGPESDSPGPDPTGPDPVGSAAPGRASRARRSRGGPDPEPGDRQLLVGAAAGDREAFGELYDRHIRPVYWQAYAVLGAADEAEEVAQETFVTLWRKIHTVVIVDDSVLPWLLTTARYQALNARRRLIKRRTAALDETAIAAAPGTDDVEAEVLAAAVRTTIAEAVAALSAHDARLYELCIDGEHSYESAARELGVTHAAVRNRLSRLRGRLRADLTPMLEQS